MGGPRAGLKTGGIGKTKGLFHRVTPCHRVPIWKQTTIQPSVSSPKTTGISSSASSRPNRANGSSPGPWPVRHAFPPCPATLPLPPDCSSKSWPSAPRCRSRPQPSRQHQLVGGQPAEGDGGLTWGPGATPAVMGEQDRPVLAGTDNGSSVECSAWGGWELGVMVAAMMDSVGLFPLSTGLGGTPKRPFDCLVPSGRPGREGFISTFRGGKSVAAGQGPSFSL